MGASKCFFIQTERVEEKETGVYGCHPNAEEQLGCKLYKEEVGEVEEKEKKTEAAFSPNADFTSIKFSTG